MIEKYGTYDVYKNVQTGEIKRVPAGQELEDELEKTGEALADWEALDHDPEME